MVPDRQERVGVIAPVSPLASLVIAAKERLSDNVKPYSSPVDSNFHLSPTNMSSDKEDAERWLFYLLRRT